MRVHLDDKQSQSFWSHPYRYTCSPLGLHIYHPIYIIYQSRPTCLSSDTVPPPHYIVWVPSPHYIEREPTCFSDTVPPPPLSSCCCRRFFISVSFITCWFIPLLLTSSSWRWFSLCSKRAFTFPTSSYKITPQCVKSSKKHKYYIFFKGNVIVYICIFQCLCLW